MIEAIIFDFDGTIFNSEPLHFQTYNELLTELAGLTITYDEYLAHYAGISDKILIPKLLGNHSIKIDIDIATLLERKRNAYTEMIETSNTITPTPGLAEFLEQVNTHYKLAICSGSFRKEIDVVLTKIAEGKFKDYFTTIVSADSVKQAKPSPEGYLLAAKLLAVDPKNCLAIEDSPTGIQAAKAAGITVIGLASTYPPEKISHADNVISDFTEIENIKGYLV